MNIVLYEPSQLGLDSIIRLGSAKARQVADVKGVVAGSGIKVGTSGGPINLAKVVSVSSDEVLLKLDRTIVIPEPESLELCLLLALPRPQSLKKVLQTIAELGVSKLVLTGAKRVQKSYFQSSVLEPASIDKYLSLGMEQVISTTKPEVLVVKRLREALDIVPTNSMKYLAHTSSADSFEEAFFSQNSNSIQNIIAVGPEGGWSESERSMFIDSGYREVSSGTRMLRVDTAVSLLSSQFALMQRMSIQKQVD